MVSSGDSGSAGCDHPSFAPATQGAAVSVLGTPFNVVVGGTEFNENGDDSKYWLDQAIRYSAPIEARKHDREVHDLGFLFMPTYYRWYQVTRDPKLKNVIIEAGKTQALRFQENGQYLRSFVAENSLFIDIMMNVGIVFFAARETSDRRLRDIALRHCLTTRRVLVRGEANERCQRQSDANNPYEMSHFQEASREPISHVSF